MVALMTNAFSPQALSHSPELPLRARRNTNVFFSLTKISTSTSFSTERAAPWPVRVRQSNAVFIQSNGSKNNSGGVTDTGALFALFGAMGLDEKESEAVLVKNPDVVSYSIESIRSRIRGLQSIGLKDLALSRLISKYPDALTAEEVDSLIHVVHGLGNEIEPGQIERLLLGTEPRFLVGFDKKVELLVEHGVPQDKIAHVLNNVNLGKAICLRSGAEIQRLLTFLSRYDAVGIIAKRPSVFNYDLDAQLVPRIGFLQKLSRGNTNGVGEVLNRLPAILTYSVEHLESHVELLRSFAGLTDQEIFKIVLIFPNVMSTSKERKLHPRISFLKECGLDSGEIYRFLIKAPLFLGLSFEKNLAHKLSLLVKIGYAHRTKDLAMAMGAVTRTSSENLQEVISLFLSYGFSFDDIVAMSKKHFQILQYNPRSLEEKMEYLIEEMDRDIGELLSFPAFLGYNLKKRIKHRYELKKKVVGEEMSLNKLLSVSSETFSKTKKHLVRVTGKSDEGVDEEDLVIP